MGLYYPWLDYKWGYEVGVPVKNPLPSDIVSVHLPFRLFAAEQLRKGIIPFWNNLILSGTPLVANFQSAIFYPLNIFLFLFSTVDAWTIQVMLQPFLTAVFTYLLLRNFKLSQLSSLFGALAFAFCGFLLVWLEYNIHGHVVYWLPAILLVVDKYLNKRKFIYLILLAIFVALALLAGYPQLVLYLALAIFIYLVFALKHGASIKSVGFSVFFACLGASVAAVQIVPGFELLRLSNRAFDASTIAIANQGFLPLRNLVNLFAPDYFGNPATGNWWGIGFYDNFAGYSGIVVIVAATVAVFTLWKRWRVQYLFFLLIISLLLSTSNPLSLMLYNSNVLGLQAAVAARALLLVGFAIALLAAFGLEELQGLRWKQEFLRATYLPWIVVVAFALATVASRWWLLNFRADFVVLNDDLQRVMEGIDITISNLRVGLRNLVLPTVILVAATVLLGIYRWARLRLLVTMVLSIIMFGELFRFGHKYLSFNRKELVFPTTPVIDFLIEKQKEEPPFRVSGGDAIPMNMLAPYGIETAEGYDAFYPLNYANFLAKVNNLDAKQPLGRYGAIERFDSELLDLANVRYVLAVKRTEGKPDPNGKPSYLFDPPKLQPVFTDGSVVVLENKDAYPRAYLEDGDGEVQFRVYEPQYKKISIDTPVATNLVLAETFYPGWQAFVDGEKVEIVEHDSVFRQISLPEGKYIVEFVYDPKAVKIGKIITAIAGIILIGLIIIESTKRINARRRISLFKSG